MTTLVQAPIEQPHAAEASAVLAGLNSTIDGLSTAEAASRLTRDGPNAVPTGRRDSAIVRFIKHFDDILIYILLGAAALKAAMGEWIDFGVILAVAFINAAIGFIQEGRAEQALDSIRSMLSTKAQVKRDGDWTSLPAEDLVVGDIVRVRSGARVPADLRLLEANNLRVEEAALTGEAEPAAKTTDPVEAEAGVGDRSSMLFSSALVASGSGVGVVTATGARAEIGRITTMLSQIDVFDTPLTRQIARFGKVLALIIAAMVVVMVLIGKLAHNLPFADVTSAAIGFAVAAIPEGLPALVTITLALGVQQMARRHAIIRRLPAVETLGAVTRVCSDKTGTLTTNEMTVRQVVTTEGIYDISGLGYAPVGDITRWDMGTVPTSQGASPVGPLDWDAGTVPTSQAELAAFVRAGAVTVDAVVQPDGDQWRLVGEPTEGALRTLGLKAGVDATVWPRLAQLPFDSEHKYSASLNRLGPDEVGLFVIGAPDRLLDRSSVQGTDSQPLDRAWWEERIAAESALGYRVLGAAFRHWNTGSDPASHSLDHADLADLTFLGLAAIQDPPRPEAIAAIATCHTAGIAVTMITGDHAGTASAIAAEMGIIPSGGSDSTAVTGAELEQATDKELRQIVDRTQVFARTSPEHKLRLVKALQANGEIVAMTGDGVNDAPALKRADVGVAMGIKGTEATKEAADIVLTDDNFATLEHAIEEGRRIHDNLHKSILFLLPANGAQALVVLVAVIFGLTLPLAPVQILWVNMVTSITLALALAYEPAEADIMTRPPRRPDAPLVGFRDLPRIAFASVVIAAATLVAFNLATYLGGDLATAQTWAVNTLALGQVAYLFNSRFLRESSLRREAIVGNPKVWLVVAILVALQAIFAYLPIIHLWFGSAAIDWLGWLIPLGFALVVLFFMEIVKASLRRFETG